MLFMSLLLVLKNTQYTSHFNETFHLWNLNNWWIGLHCLCTLKLIFKADDIAKCCLGFYFVLLQTWAPQCEIATFYAIDEKFRIFVQFSLNFQGMTAPWMGQSLKVWAKLIKNCGFFIDRIEMCNFTLGCPDL